MIFMRNRSINTVFEETGTAKMPVSYVQSGFTLVETMVALVIVLVALLGVFYSFTYAILYNAGNATRTQCLATMQQEVEQIRAAKFTPTQTDSYAPSGANCRTDGLRDLTGGVKTACRIQAPNGGDFRVETTVDDDPFTTGVQVDATSTMKEITITVRLDSPSPGWQTAVPATVILRRTRGN
jgi:prepilin-type N-terminal cleavage/methylation domain-containing protein